MSILVISALVGLGVISLEVVAVANVWETKPSDGLQWVQRTAEALFTAAGSWAACVTHNIYLLLDAFWRKFIRSIFTALKNILGPIAHTLASPLKVGAGFVTHLFSVATQQHTTAVAVMAIVLLCALVVSTYLLPMPRMAAVLVRVATFVIASAGVLYAIAESAFPANAPAPTPEDRENLDCQETRWYILRFGSLLITVVTCGGFTDAFFGKAFILHVCVPVFIFGLVFIFFLSEKSLTEHCRVRTAANNTANNTANVRRRGRSPTPRRGRRRGTTTSGHL